MIETYLNTLATVLGKLHTLDFNALYLKKHPRKFKGLPCVLWVLLDSYIDVKNKDYGGDNYINGEIIPCQYSTYQPKQARSSKYKSKAYVRQRDGPPSEQRRSRQGATPESAS